MNCRAAKKLMLPYVEGVLDAGRKSGIQQHLNSCKSCQEECRAIDRMRQVLQSSAPDKIEPASDLWARVSAQIQPARRVQPPKPWWTSAPAVGAAAMVLIAVILSPMLYKTSQRAETTSKIARSPFGAMGGPGMKGTPPSAMASAPGGAVMCDRLPSKPDAPVLKRSTPTPAAPVMLARAPRVPDVDSLAAAPPSRPVEMAMAEKPAVAYNMAAPAASSAEKTQAAAPGVSAGGANNAFTGSSGMPGGSGIESESNLDTKSRLSSDSVRAAPMMDAAESGAPSAAMGRMSKSDKDMMPAASRRMMAVLEERVTSGDKEAAAVQADKLYGMQKIDQKTWFRLGELEEKLGRKLKALEAYRKSTDGPDKAIAGKALEQIARLEK